MAQNRHIYALFGLSTATPKPRAEGSSPSAPAKQSGFEHVYFLF